MEVYKKVSHSIENRLGIEKINREDKAFLEPCLLCLTGPDTNPQAILGLEI